MQFDDEITSMNAQVLQINVGSVKCCLPNDQNREMLIPRAFFKALPKEGDTSITLPKWYLKRNRIIPIDS